MVVGRPALPSVLRQQTRLPHSVIMADDQRDVIDFLSKASSYGTAVERVDVVETHVSLVFLAGDRAYKLKRAAKFPYLDFSSAEQR